MNEVFNLSRREVVEFSPSKESIWISIGEPCDRFGKEFLHVSSKVLDKIPSLKIKFWDIIDPVIDLSNPIQRLNPPGEEEAKLIIDFILNYPNRDIIINCAAGVSRSGAIAQFCEDRLGYKWGMYKRRASPNRLLYRLLYDYYNSLNRESP